MGATCNYYNKVASKLSIVPSLNEYTAKMPQYLFLAMMVLVSLKSSMFLLKAIFLKVEDFLCFLKNCLTLLLSIVHEIKMLS